MIPVAVLLAGVIPRKTVSITSFGATTLDQFRRATEGAPTTVTRTIPMHPATSRRMLDKLPEIDRYRETIALYDAPSSPLIAAPGCKASEVVVDGRSYDVTHVGDYQTQGGIVLILASLRDSATP